MCVSLRVRRWGESQQTARGLGVCGHVCEGFCTSSWSGAAGLRDLYTQVPASGEAKIHGQLLGRLSV